MRQVAPTRSQKIMLFFMGMILVGLIGFTVVEVRGILSPLPEDTFSEWVFDLPTWAILVIDVPFVAVAVIAAWASIHFLVDRNAAWRGEFTDRFMGEGHRTPAKVIRPIVELLEDWYFPPRYAGPAVRQQFDAVKFTFSDGPSPADVPMFVDQLADSTETGGTDADTE